MIDALAEAILSQKWGWDSIRRDAFQLLAWGYADAEAKIRQETLEVNITGMLSEAMDNKLSYGQLPARFALYNVKEEAHVNKPGRVGNTRTRLDIMVEHTGQRPYRKYVLEAKRCSKNYRGGIKWYVKGIESFLALDYAEDAPEASVIGLVQKDTIEHWKDELRTYAPAGNSLRYETTPADTNIVDELPCMTVSTHRREDDSLIDLYHIFLDCRNPSI